ncbi:hypothetical protein B0H10DRAFT_1906963 [Mycena sp. CBHHK59/15]|nr:hypothetical protein B0H10DRAFT_1906963 [Mycena sp. CBHHK59/15]
MSPPFCVRQLDPSTALDASNPTSLPEIDAIESVLSKAFADDRFTAVVTAHDPKGTDTSHVGPFWKSTVGAGLLGGEVYVAETADAQKKIVGCAVWFGPGHSMYDTEEQQKFALGPLMAAFNEDLQQWWHADFLPKYDAFVASALGEGTKHNSWHLQTIGVDPEYQRKHVATSLVNAVIEKAALSNAPLCLECENENNVVVYTKLGFEITPKGKGDNKEKFTGVDGNAFFMWVMARGSK